MADISITIIGAGVIGLAIANELSKDYNDIFVIERHKKFGQETSSRNSEVIHAGIYYPQNSLKAKLCVKGNKLLYDFCRKYEVEHLNCGKFIVATNQEEAEQLKAIKLKAKANGVGNMTLLSGKEVNEKEPHVKAIKGLFSPNTGVINASGYMKRLESLSIINGIEFSYHSDLKKIEFKNETYKLHIKDADGNNFSFTSQYVINAAGLEADRVAAMLGIKDEALRIQFCKGEYFRINPPKNKLVHALIYPVPLPNMAGLGIHSTIDFGGGLKLGPDAEYQQDNIYDYRVNPDKKQAFYEAAKKFLPFLELNDLSPEMVGIRPKIQKEGESFKDFYIQEESKRGFSGFINLIGMESPGLTASLAIAKYVKGILF